MGKASRETYERRNKSTSLKPYQELAIRCYQFSKQDKNLLKRKALAFSDESEKLAAVVKERNAIGKAICDLYKIEGDKLFHAQQRINILDEMEGWYEVTPKNKRLLNNGSKANAKLRKIQESLEKISSELDSLPVNIHLSDILDAYDDKQSESLAEQSAAGLHGIVVKWNTLLKLYLAEAQGGRDVFTREVIKQLAIFWVDILQQEYTVDFGEYEFDAPKTDEDEESYIELPANFPKSETACFVYCSFTYLFPHLSSYILGGLEDKMDELRDPMKERGKIPSLFL